MKTNPNDPISMGSAQILTEDGIKSKYLPGLTKREYFAAMAMQALTPSSGVYHSGDIAKRAVKMADALIASLNANKTEE